MYFPNPWILKAKIQGHIIEQNSPPLIKANKATYPLENKPINIAIVPSTPNIFRVEVGLSFPKKKPAICKATKIAYQYRLDTSNPETELTPNTIPSAP